MNKQYFHNYYLKNKNKWKKYNKMTLIQKEARAEYERKRYIKNKDEILEYQRTTKARFIFARSHSKHYKRDWSITFEEYENLLNRACFYCGSSILNQKGVGLDRIDNKKGYLLNNVLPCCGDCNYIRQDLLTVEEMKVEWKQS
jgi:hypothetical protein